ncbi:MAG: SIS domain-containing protein [Candidatus Acidiferrum sp.]
MKPGRDLMRSDELHEEIVRGLNAGAEVHARLADACGEALLQAVHQIHKAMAARNKLLLFGNGGSAGDAQHTATEFVCRFGRNREALPAVALTTDSSVLTAIANDFGFEQVFARQVRALGRTGDIAMGISTSGRSANVLEGVRAARELGLVTIALTGGAGGELAQLADIVLLVPSEKTASVQECHIALLHAMCEATETLLYGDPPLEPGA